MNLLAKNYVCFFPPPLQSHFSSDFLLLIFPLRSERAWSDHKGSHNLGAKRRGDYFVFDDNLKSSLTFLKMMLCTTSLLDTGHTLLKTQGL